MMDKVRQKALQIWAEKHQIHSLLQQDPSQIAWMKHWDQPLAELHDSIDMMSGLTKIDLRHNGLRRLSSSLGKLLRLEDLTSMGNDLESLPDVFQQLKQLRYFDMRENCLHHLPPSIGALENLRQLILCSNLMVSLPKEIGQLKKLVRLDLSRNPLRSLPSELQYCTALEYLDISGTLINHLPEWLGEMPHLKHLVCGLNRVAQMEQALGRTGKHPPIESTAVDNEPFQLWFERQLATDPYGPLKITFRRVLKQDLSDAEIDSKARGLVGSEDWPEGWFVWGQDEAGEYVEYYLTSRWGDGHGRIGHDGHHTDLPVLSQVGPIDEEYETLAQELRAKGLLDR